jgi:hypothetical protein
VGYEIKEQFVRLKGYGMMPACREIVMPDALYQPTTVTNMILKMNGHPVLGGADLKGDDYECGR